ncbi:MAG: HAMP domain-containing histidine kinase [Actinomycetota bacterium]|nr:HAMP domain-containing histidine kinase [Actinomycetota bacterium]
MRKRIVGLTVLAAVLATCLFGIPLAAVAAHYFITDERAELERTADTVALAVSADLTRATTPGALPPSERGMQVTVYTSAGVRVAGSGPPQTPQLVRRSVHGAVASGSVGGRMAVAVPVSDGDTVTGAVLVSGNRAEVYWRIAKSWLAMAVLASLAVGVAWQVARRQARRLAAPLEHLGSAAERLGAGDFSVRGTAVGIAELDSVSDSLNRTAVRLGFLVERERAFSSDASHQLRTPLTGLRLGLEAALDSPDSDHRSAMVDALAATGRLESTVTDLLALARGVPASSCPLDVDELMKRVHVRWNGPLATDGRPLRITTNRPIPETAMSPQAATQILDVLLDNAYRHGGGVVSITVRDADDVLAIDVANDGPAITSDPHDLFGRRSAAGESTGLGLALARRLAEAEGGRLVLSSNDPVRFTLLVPRLRRDRDGCVPGERTPRQPRVSCDEREGPAIRRQ